MSKHIGKEYGRLTVLRVDRIKKVVSKVSGKESSVTYLMCSCSCGNEVSVASNSLGNGNTKSCGCLRKELLHEKGEDLTNQVFDRLTAVKRLPGNGTKWLCQCSCGNTTITKAMALKAGATRSCGCLQKEHAVLNSHSRARKYRESKGLDPDEPLSEKRQQERARLKVIRKQVFERDSYTCACCGVVGSRLNAHHIETWAMSPELRFEVENLVTLCVSCHKYAHKGNFNILPDEPLSILLRGYTKVIEDYNVTGGSYDLLRA